MGSVWAGERKVSPAFPLLTTVLLAGRIEDVALEGVASTRRLGIESNRPAFAKQGLGCLRRYM